MGYKIIFYKTFQNALHIARDIVIVLLILIKCHIFMALSSKILFEETQMSCSLIMKSVAFMIYFIYIL